MSCIVFSFQADSVISNGEDFSLSSCQALDGSRSSTPLNGLQNSFYNLYLPSQELLWSAMPKPSDTSKVIFSCYYYYSVTETVQTFLIIGAEFDCAVSVVGRVWRIGTVDAFCLKGHGFDSCSSCQVGTLGKSFT